jgi:hypothetical protein
MLKWGRAYQPSNRQIILTQTKLPFFNMESNILMSLPKSQIKMNRKTTNFTKNCKRLLKLNKIVLQNKKKIRTKLKKNRKATNIIQNKSI